MSSRKKYLDDKQSANIRGRTFDNTLVLTHKPCDSLISPKPQIDLLSHQWVEDLCACHLIDQLRLVCWVAILPTKWVALFVFCFEMKEINGKGDIIKIWISILGHHCRDMAIVIIPDDWREWSLSWEQSFPKNLQEQMSVCKYNGCLTTYTNTLWSLRAIKCGPP